MEEIIAIISLFAILPSIVVAGILLYQRQKKALGAGSTVSLEELEAVIRRSGAEAVEPLHERIDRLESSLEAVGRLRETPAARIELERIGDQPLLAEEKTLGRTRSDIV